ncbi:hypothetical protein SAMN04515665_10989 [Blastococcus sp. DSM 46786]|uniref:hypothetical protein n=1 Tax=Blastococcus sp. DSM 46786 TaxID=1798227 RepID=UPI0008BD9795|nr:hypothetical protein [Blastococcus sp. DSM 46786]SEL18871.1 hypothetical protein SAMN04515665_10989 [Blastococcus sp. DSM 46786]
MPLRSVEAASRDDAIAAAREQFGPHARVVGVRRVRSGGVLGFFATERYIAEVAPDQFARPGVPSPSTGPAQATPVAAYDSPLAAAAPARARASAPARNGAAAWAAEAARPAPAEPAARPATPRTGATAASWSPAPVARLARDDERIDELAGLLGGGAPTATGGSPATAAPAPGYGRSSAARATFPKATREPTATPRRQPAAAPAPPAEQPDAGAAPSPFTAALARMVSGDRDVRQAVDHALAQPAEPVPAAPARDPFAVAPAPAARPSLAAAIRSADPSMRSQAVQEETTVREQATAPPSTSTSTTGAEELPRWAAAPQEPAAPAPSARQEEIAEALRDALAQGHSDEALAGILRKMLAGDSPRAALAEPVLPLAVIDEPALPVPVLDEPGLPVGVLDEPGLPVGVLDEPGLPVGVLDEPGLPVAVLDEPAPRTEVLPDEPAPPVPAFDDAALPAAVLDEPVREEARPADVAADPSLLFAPTGAHAPVLAPVPVTPEPVVEPVVGTSFSLFDAPAAPAPVPADLGWGGSAGGTTLWGEPVPAFPAADDAPIWADVLLAAPAPVADIAGPAEELLAAPPVADIAAPAEPLAAAPAADEPVAEEPPAGAPVAEESVVEDAVVEDAVAAETVVPQPVVLQTALEQSVAVEAEEAVAAETVAPQPVVADAPIADAPIADAPIEQADVEQADVEQAGVEQAAVEQTAAADLVEAAPLLARTASDPAPLSMSLDATTVMPRISLLPPLSGARGRGLPPVPPSSGRPAVPPSRSAAAGPRADAAPETPQEESAPAAPVAPVAGPVTPAAAPATRTLATVTRLPVAPLMAGDDHPDMPELEDDAAEPATDVPSAPRTGAAPATPREVVARLTELGVPRELLGEDVVDRIEADGTYAALTRALTERLPEAPRLPTGAGEVLFVVGPGVETLRAARALAASLRLDPDRVQWATRGDLAGLAPKGSRMTTIDAAIDRRQEAADAGTLTIVAVDAPLRSDVYWMSQMLAIWSPVAVWAVVEATRKPEDLELWLDGLARVDALVVQDTDLSADPAAVLQRLTVPVALLDGVRATPHRWASLLCERLDSPQA